MPKPFSSQIEIQGHLLKASTKGHEFRCTRDKKRGKVDGFSRKSRNRLIEKAQRLDTKSGIKPVFLTLTYGRDYPHPRIAKKHLFTFLKRIHRIAPLASAIWKLEFQKRGAPHFHLIMFNMPYTHKSEIQRMWGEIIGIEEPFTRIEMIHGFKQLMKYVSKYVAKVDAGGFNPLPYLTVDEETGELSDGESIGRWWGIFMKCLIPYAQKVVFHWERTKGQAILHDLRRAASRRTKHVRRKRAFFGFMLFTGNSQQWHDYVQYLILLHCPDMNIRTIEIG